MSTRNKHESSSLGIIEAVETLSNIADLEFDQNMGITQEHDLVLHEQKVTYRTVHWLHEKDADQTIAIVKDTFRVILHYLKEFYKKEYGYISDEKTIEGIKTIMVLVGEAAKKLDKYSSLFHQKHAKSVTELKEYKQLQEFYLSRISRKIDEGVLGAWILALTRRAVPKKPSLKLLEHKPTQTKHIFIDLETVKKDTEYELFFLRKEDGSRFFNPRLIRNIKLVCDFGHYFGKTKSDDPFQDLIFWQDQLFHASAKKILKSAHKIFETFGREGSKHKDHELVLLISKAMIALMLSSNPHHLLRNNPAKSCVSYFEDFQFFLREALHSREYQRLIAYLPDQTDKLSLCLLDTIHALSWLFFVSLQGYQDIGKTIQKLLQEAMQEISSEHLTHASFVWSQLAAEHTAMTKLLKHHPNGPLSKVLDVLEQGIYHFFDPIRQQNLPSQLYSIYFDERHVMNLHIPIPVHQEFIHKAMINEEFLAFLRYLKTKTTNDKHLIFNLQDRTSWREYSRSVLFEELQKREEFNKNLVVVTLSMDTEFFHQLPPYQEDKHANVFIKHFKEHLQDENSGFYFPDFIKKAIFPKFVDGMIHTIHRIFFHNKNVLLREERLNFIEIFYTFLQLKIIELIKPESINFACKDGIDIGAVTSSQLYLFLKLINQEKLSESEIEYINILLYTPAILIRERLILPERFNRMLNVIKMLENLKQEIGKKAFCELMQEAFSHYFKSDILQAKIILVK